jgi:hypothetical protein
MKFNDITLNGKVYKLVHVDHPNNDNGCEGCSFDYDYEGCKKANEIQSCDGPCVIYIERERENITSNEKKPHMHADAIKAWADGAEIQYWDDISGKWEDARHFVWDEETNYRIKPNEPKQPVVRWLWAVKTDSDWIMRRVFNSEEEIALDQSLYATAKFVKLEWTRTEFPE